MGLTGCGKARENQSTNINNNESSKSIYNSLAEYIEAYFNDEIEFSKLENYLVNNINGYYYYYGTYGELRRKRNGAYTEQVNVSDFRTIFVKSRDEVYIVPFSKKELDKQNIDLEDIDKLNNDNLYKYKISEITTLKDKYVNIKFISYKSNETNNKNFDSVSISYYYHDDYYYITGYFMDMSSKLDDDETMHLYNTRIYYTNEEQAIYLHKIKTSEPAIGMNKAEVLLSKWGKPDKKTEYKNGYEEWTYWNKGCVQFHNDVVWSVQC